MKNFLYLKITHTLFDPYKIIVDILKGPTVVSFNLCSFYVT